MGSEGSIFQKYTIIVLVLWVKATSFFWCVGLLINGKLIRIYFLIGILDLNTFSFSYFLLDQKVTKNQGFIKIQCVSNPEVSSRNTRHGKCHKSRLLSLLCIATHSLPHIPPAKNRYCIFIRPVLRMIVLTWGQTGSEGSGKYCRFLGYRDWPYRNFTQM